MKQWKWISAMVLGGVLFAAAMNLQAQAPAGKMRATVVVTCDVRQIFRDYQKAKDLMVEMRKRQVKIEAEGERRKTAIESQQKGLEGLKEGSPEHKRIVAAMQRSMIDREVWMRVEEQGLMQDHMLQTKAMRDEIVSVVRYLAKVQGFDVVIQMNTDAGAARSPQELIAQIASKKVLFSSEKVNITPNVISLLNNAYAKVKSGR